MQNRIKYDISRLKSKHDQLAFWLPDGKAMFSRFEDGTEGQPSADPPTDPPADSLVDPPAAPPADPSVKDAPSSTLLDVAGLVNPDGSLVADWYKSESLPEEVRGSESLGVIKSLADLAKRTVHAEKMVGKSKIALPKADADPAEWASFFEAVGKANPEYAKPASSQDYKFDVPEGLEDLYTEEKLNQTKEIAHKIGVTQSQFEQFMKADAEATAAAVQEARVEAERKHDEDVLALKKEWGEAYPERQHVVKRLISEAFGNNETKKMDFLQKFAGDPDFVRFAANIGSRLVESKALVAELTQSTPDQALREIEELRATTGYLSPSSDMTDAQRTEITSRIREKYKEAYPSNN